MDKRTFLKSGALMGLGSLMLNPELKANTFFNSGFEAIDPNAEEYQLPPLPYDYAALEPHIDAQTMKLHHDVHHQGYVNGLNNATKMVKQAIDSDDYALIKHWERELAFHGSGHFLHSIFWTIMGPSQGTRSQDLEKYIKKDFGSFEKFKNYFIAASNAVEGSGWGILAYQPQTDKLVILQAEKHHNLTQWTTVPLLVVDVWEHAYYLKYQNKRKDYIGAFFNVINWSEVSEKLKRLRS